MMEQEIRDNCPMLFEAIQKAVFDGKARLVEKNIQEGLRRGLDPKEILEKGLLAALDSLEQNLCADEMQITTSLAYAKAMKKGLECLEPILGEQLYDQECTILIGTATGDLHDMGKNIVALYFRTAGFRVVDLGVDVSAAQFLKALAEHKDAGIVCISSLMKSSLPEVRNIIQSIRNGSKQRKIYIMVGGGSVTAELADAYGADCYTETAAGAAIAARAYMEACRAEA